MYGIAVMGYGVVGSGVAEALRTNSGHILNRTGEQITVLKILDIYSYPDSPDAHLITHDVNDIMRNDDIKIVVETIGGVGVAHQFTKMAFENGKHVVTSNKDLVAAYGPELLRMADENNVLYLFEASVGGGIPIIRPLERCLIANEIDEIVGILNGTTNYMLTYMREFGSDFGTALKLAQEKGYAEKDPTSDVEGHDARRKIAILSSIAYGAFVDHEELYSQGISNIGLEDIYMAEELGYVIKLIARSKRVGDKAFCAVYPMMIDKRIMLSNVDWVYNGILVKGNIVGDVMFYGRGAGKLPTASAVVSDIVDIMEYGQTKKNYKWDRGNKLKLADAADEHNRFYARVEAADRNGLIDAILREFPDASVLPAKAGGGSEGAASFTTNAMKEREFMQRLESVKNSAEGYKAHNYIRIYSEGGD